MWFENKDAAPGAKAGYAALAVCALLDGCLCHFTNSAQFLPIQWSLVCYSDGRMTTLKQFLSQIHLWNHQSKPACLFYWSAFISFHFPFTFEMLKKLYSCILFLPSKRFQVSSLFFAFIVVTCTFIYIYIFLDIVFSVSIILHVFLFSGLIIWYWIICWCSLSWERVFLPFSEFFQVPVFLRVMLKSFPLSLWHVYCY